MRYAPLLLLLLPACDPGLPPANAAISAQAQAQGFPRLLPLDPLLAEGTRASRAAAAQASLRARGAGLRGARITAPATGDLATRGQRLRQRAAELRAVDI
ncbi:hypothetical protein [Jannaschia donghaensis]|uniref:Uncharacterized protein n=1 Tax=Jannaschia donghaensis TaxID=420998 RepID=A0A0M6YKY1_9RHOB|nr:hypothetical protein [Jannaschia donghaensis]CTQ50325.1 hypothetical protein JDO7802_02347 [Jannaschia donghaensis]